MRKGYARLWISLYQLSITKIAMREVLFSPLMLEVCTYYLRSIRIFEHVARHHRLYQALLGDAGPPGIAPLWKTYFTELYQRRVLSQFREGSSASVKYDLLAAHAAGSLMGLIDYWLKEELSPSAEEMGSLYWRLMSASINEALGRGLDTVERDTSRKSGLPRQTV